MQKTVSSSRTYYHDIDVLRGLLMALGIVLHGAMYLDAGFALRWIDMGVSSQIYNNLGLAIRFFRMETFFLIAGFFAAMLAARYETKRLLSGRAVRLLVPMLIVGLTFNLSIGFLNESGLGKRWPLHAAYWSSGQWLSHLWFLPVLFVYTLLYQIVRAVLRRLPPLMNINFFRTSPYLVLVLVYVLYPVLVFLCARIGWRAEDSTLWGQALFGLLWAPEVFEYIPDFFLGVLIWKVNGLRAWTRLPLMGVHLVLGVLCLYGIFLMTGLDARLEELLRHMVALPIAFFLMGLFRLLFPSPKPWCKSVANASYTVYLLHMPLLICIAYGVKQIGIESPHLVFAILFWTTLMLCLAAHWFIQKNPLAQLLLNGRRLRRPAKRLDGYPESYKAA